MAHLFSRPSYSSTHFSQASLTQLRPDATECSEDTTELPPASLRSASGARRPSLLRDERGLSTVEYVILLALIVVGCVGAWTTFRDTLLAKLNNGNTTLQGVGAASEDGSTGSGTPPSSDSDPSASTGSPSSSGSGDLLQQAATAAQQAAQDAGL